MWDLYFWALFDRTGSGACVAIQTTLLGATQCNGCNGEYVPVFMPCSSLNLLACEAVDQFSNYVTEEPFKVKMTK